MKFAFSLAAAAAVLFSAGSAFPADGQVPRDQLAALGLSSAVPMSDAEGLLVRGEAVRVNIRAFFGSRLHASARVDGPGRHLRGRVSINQRTVARIRSRAVLHGHLFFHTRLFAAGGGVIVSF